MTVHGLGHEFVMQRAGPRRRPCGDDHGGIVEDETSHPTAGLPALYSEITTGCSAPQMGRVIATNQVKQRKERETTPCCIDSETTMSRATARSRIARFQELLAVKRTGLRD